MQLLHVKLGPFAHTGPKNRPAFVMHFEHVLFGFLPRIAEHALEHHCDVGHQIHRIIVHYHLPRKIDILL